MEIGSRIRSARNGAGYTQERAAALAGLLAGGIRGRGEK